MASVTLPRGVLIALVASLLACLGITAFLAGRASVPPRPEVSTAPLPEGAAPAAAPGEPARQPPPSQSAALPMPPALELSTQAQEPPPPGGGGPTPPGTHPEATRVGSTVVPALPPPPPAEVAR